MARRVPKAVWETIKEIFVTSPERPKWMELSEKFGISERSLIAHAKAEDWYGERERFQEQIKLAMAGLRGRDEKAQLAGEAAQKRRDDLSYWADQMQRAVAAVFAKLANSVVRNTKDEEWDKLPLGVKIKLLSAVPRSWIELVKLQKLLEGEATERIAFESLSEVPLTEEEQELIDELWEKVHAFRSNANS